MDVEAGEIFGLLGPDGAGKTTLLQIFAAILDPTSGACSVLGFDTKHEDAEVNARIGYMSQGFTLYGRLSVDENLRFAARIRGVKPQEYAERSQRLLAMAGLTQFHKRWAEKLSGGMRKKLSLCCSLVHQPKLLLLDELSLGVDPLSRRELWQMLHAFRDEGVTVVISTPYMGEAEYCDRLCFLHQGRVLDIDSPRQLARRADGSTFTLQSSKPNSIVEILRQSAEVVAVTLEGTTIRIRTESTGGLRTETSNALERLTALEQAKPTLEDAFMYLSQRQIEAPEQSIFVSRSAPESDDRPTKPRVVELAGLTVTFGSFVALDNVSLSVRRGEVFGFLGPNGAGKTTLIRVLCGMLRPTAGTATVAGIDVLRRPRQLAARIGYMSQQFSLYPDLTCAENLSFFGGIYGLRGKTKQRAIEKASQLVDLEPHLTRTAKSLSGAVRQRLALACSILHEPDVLFLDEPTSGVDPVSRRRFWQLIRDQATSGVTVFVTTHYLDEATNCDRIGLMSAGRLLADGTVENLRERLHLDASSTMEDIFMTYIAQSSAEEKAAK